MMYKSISVTLVAMALSLFSIVSHAQDVELQVEVNKAQEQLDQVEEKNIILREEVEEHENDITEKRQLLQELEARIDELKLELKLELTE